MTKKTLSIVLIICMLLGAAPAMAAQTDAASVDAGTSTNGLLDANGDFWTWGNNASGALGQNTQETRLAAAKVMSGVKQISICSAYTLFLDKQNVLWGMGQNSTGQLMDKVRAGGGVVTGSGNGASWIEETDDGEKATKPVRLMDNVIQVSAGDNHVLAIKSDSSVWVWGSNQSGQLGNGKIGSIYTTPAQVMTDVISVFAGRRFSYAIKSDGSLWQWGNECVFPTKNNPLPVKVMDGVKEVQGGENHIVLLKNDGSVWTIGDNFYGQCGTGTEEKYTSWNKVLEGAVKVAAGMSTSAAIDKDGKLYVWGSNMRGEVGDGTYSNARVPVVVLTDVESVALGTYHVLALQKNGKLKTWGWTKFGGIPGTEAEYVRLPAEYDYVKNVLSEQQTAQEPMDGTLPTAPSWIKASEYQVYEGDMLYTSTDWNIILDFRKQAEGGLTKRTIEMQDFLTSKAKPSADSPAVYFELGLIFEKIALNAGISQMDDTTLYAMGTAFSECTKKEITANGINTYLTNMWLHRQQFIVTGTAQKIYNIGDPKMESGMTLVDKLSRYPEFNKQKFFDHPFFDEVKKSRNWDKYYNYIFVYVDGERVYSDAAPEAPNGRTMIPIRAVAETLGAQIAWDGQLNTVTLNRASDSIVLTINSNIASKNGVPITLDAAPYVKQNRTYLPLRFISEQFGQKVSWLSGGVVDIDEDTQIFDSTNVDEWMIGMHAGYVGNLLHAFTLRYGMYPRNAESPAEMRASLAQNWGVTDRDSLIRLVADATQNGIHQAQYKEEMAQITGMTEQERAAAKKTNGNGYMIDQMVAWNKKWGDRGIVAWDSCRVTMLSEWGYVAGYLTLKESIALGAPAAKAFREAFTNWDDGIQNYLDGFAWWSQTDITKEDSEYQTRLDRYPRLKADRRNEGQLQDSLFKEVFQMLSTMTFEDVVPMAP